MYGKSGRKRRGTREDEGHNRGQKTVRVMYGLSERVVEGDADSNSTTSRPNARQAAPGGIGGMKPKRHTQRGFASG